MKVLFERSLKKDLIKLKDNKLKSKIKSIILDLEETENLNSISNLKKMKSKKVNAYRIRIGDYRLGFYVNDDVITLARFVKRSDIYNVFP